MSASMISIVLAWIVFGAFVPYFWKRGGQEGNPLLKVIGVLLLVYPYVVFHPLAVWLVGAGLMYAGFKIGG